MKDLIGTGVSGVTNTQAYRYEEIDVSPSRRSAKRDPDRLAAYLLGKARQNEPVSRDMARRSLGDRPFIGWDGEGYTSADGKHHYMLFGASTGEEISSPSLDTKACLDLLLTVEARHPDSFHVIFAGNYDVNMILRDLPVWALKKLKEDGVVKWEGYTLGYIKSKMFRVKKGDVSLTLYDIFTFFGVSFVKALEQYIGADDADVTRIRLGKTQRSAFDFDSLPDVREYFRAELRYLVRLSDTLRKYLTEAGIRLSKWHGPGAVASTVLRSKRLTRIELPRAIGLAAQYAYLGGRFEQFKIGTHEGTVYQYDIRSAYPSAIATLPRLGSDWRHESAPTQVQAFGMYRVVYTSNARDAWKPHPFGWRHRNGAVFYPPTHGGGWVWGTELQSALRYAPGEIRILEGWVLDDTGERPYAWIAEMYERRARWKLEGRPAELALKLAMNSIYGKLAQQVGWRIKNGSITLPKFHQLEYAGYITAFARGRLYEAMHQAGDALIATETDAVYSTRSLDLDIGPDLGQWEESRYDGVIYVQSGMYFAREKDEWKHRTRGFGRGDIKIDSLRDWLSGIHTADDAYNAPPFVVSQTRFRTMGTSIGKDDWRTWVTSDREIHAGTPGGKREHYRPLCVACERSMGSLSTAMHEMVPAVTLRGIDYTQESQPYPLEWLSDKASEFKTDSWDVFEEEVYG